MYQPARRNLIVRLFVFTFVVAPQCSSTSIAYDSLFAPPAFGATDGTNVDPWIPPVDELAASSDDSSVGDDEELLVEMDLDSELGAAENRRDDRGRRGGPMGDDGPPIRYRVFAEPRVNVDGQSAKFEHWGQEINVAFPAWTEEPGLLLVSTTVANDLFDTAALFPRNGLEFPESLWDVGFGLKYFRDLENDWKFGGGLEIGSPSDRPFAALRDVSPSTFAFLSIPSRGQDSWNLSVFYSPNSEIPFPIPGIAYYWHASDELQMNIGLPAQLTWRPTERFTFAASYMILHTITARGTWQLSENWSTYLAYENRNRAWFLHDRQRDDERLFSYDQALIAGLQRSFFDKFQAELTAGYLFERFYFLGEDYSDRNRDRIDIDAGLTVSAQIGVAF